MIHWLLHLGGVLFWLALVVFIVALVWATIPPEDDGI